MVSNKFIILVKNRELFSWFLFWVLAIILFVISLFFIKSMETELREFAGTNFEKAIRTALQQKEYPRAERIATGAMRIWIGRQDVDAYAKLLRSHARSAQGKLDEAISDLREATGFLRGQPWFVTESARNDFWEIGSILAEKLCTQQRVHDAILGLSLAARGSGVPGDFLQRILDTLDPQIKTTLWHEEPKLLIEDFEDASSPIPELRGNPSWTFENGFDSSTFLEGKRSGFIRVTQKRNTSARIGTRLRIQVTEQALFGLRFWVNIQGAPVTRTRIIFWSDGPFLTHSVFLDNPIRHKDSWQLFDASPEVLYADLPKEMREALKKEDLQILDIEIEIGGDTAFQCNIDGIEVYLPYR